MRYMVILFIIDIISMCGLGMDDAAIERIVKIDFRSKKDANAWSDALIAAQYTERVPKNQGYKGNRYKIDKVVINYNSATSDNIKGFVSMMK